MLIHWSHYPVPYFAEKSVHALTVCMRRPGRANASAAPCAWALRSTPCTSTCPSRIPRTANSACFTQEQRAASNKFSRFPHTLLQVYQANACWRAPTRAMRTHTPEYPLQVPPLHITNSTRRIRPQLADAELFRTAASGMTALSSATASHVLCKPLRSA